MDIAGKIQLDVYGPVTLYGSVRACEVWSAADDMDNRTWVKAGRHEDPPAEIRRRRRAVVGPAVIDGHAERLRPGLDDDIPWGAAHTLAPIAERIPGLNTLLAHCDIELLAAL